MFSLRALNYGLILLLLSSVATINANVSNSPSSIEDKRELAPRALANGAALRILCLGASITFGYGSSDGNGYRYALRGALVQGGSKVNMIGSVSHGNMNDNQVEAWPGYRIAEVDKKAELSLPSMPNVVLIFVGTNDMTQNFDVPNAHIRMGNLLDQIFQAVPNTAIVVATLLPNEDPAAEANILIFNKNLIGIVNDRAASGKKISLVDMHSDWFSTADLQGDGTHPTDTGYMKMARVFYNGIVGFGDQISSSQSVAGVDDAAAKDDPGAGSALDAVCKQIQGQTMGAAEGVQCGSSAVATSAVVASAVATKVVASSTLSPSAVPSNTPSTSASTSSLLRIAISPSTETSSTEPSRSVSSSPISPSTLSASRITSSTESSRSVSSSNIPPTTLSVSTASSNTASAIPVSPSPISSMQVASSSTPLAKPTPSSTQSGSSHGKYINKYLLLITTLAIASLYLPTAILYDIFALG